MIKLTALLAKVKYIWSLWDLRGFIIFSFSLQFILIIGSSLRVQTSRAWVHRLIWLAYLLADWAAYYAIGLVVPINRLKDQLDTYDIHSFWAPFLLLHIGGPNTIAGFSLEDNDLWNRSLLHIVVQAGATVISIFQSLSKKRLLAPTLLILVAAITRYAGRILALYKGSMDVLRGEIVASNIRNRTQSIAVSIPTEVVSAPTEVVSAKPMDLAAHSYHLFQKYKGIFCGLSNPEVMEDRENLLHRGKTSNEVWIEMEMELSIAYEYFYTKIWTIVEDRKGKILHLVSLASEVVALVLWALASKDGYHKVDIKITNTLLIGGLFLDVISMVKLLFSDLVICHFIKRKPNSRLVSWAMNKVLLARERATSFVLFRRWSGSIKQIDLRAAKKLSYVDSILGLERDTSTIQLTDAMKEQIFECIRKRVSEFSRDESGIQGCETSIEIGWYSLRVHNNSERISNAIQHICEHLGVIDALLIWNTATSVYYSMNHLPQCSQSELRKNNNEASNYMMYLVYYRSNLIIEGAQVEISVEEIRDRLGDVYQGVVRTKADNISDIITREQHRSLAIMKYHRTANKAPLQVVIDLAGYVLELLVSVGPSEEIINDIWADFLLYTAVKCRGRSHVQQLGNGGELLTLVWLLMKHVHLNVDLPRSRLPL